MTNQHPEAGPMLFADCPLCGTPSPLVADGGALECPDCDVRLELAADETPVLAVAA